MRDTVAEAPLGRSVIESDGASAWRSPRTRASLAESFRSVAVAAPGASFWRRLLSFSGPG